MVHTNIFSGRRATLVTQHKKEEIIAPLLAEVGIHVQTIHTIDTDSFGSFTGEIKRLKTAEETVQKKALAGSPYAPDGLVLASEGSFYPDPHIPFCSKNTELVMLIDIRNNISILGIAHSRHTAHHEASITSLAELDQFLEKIEFPDHSVIVSHPKLFGLKKCYKKDWGSKNEIYTYTEKLLKKGIHVFVATDMRAMNNKKRRSVIREATQDLIEKIKSTCPHCGTPGFTVHHYEYNTRCSLCNAPTHAASDAIYICQTCTYTQKKQIASFTDPSACIVCNP